jgi:tetratricopeptide (TPR) repeat protein
MARASAKRAKRARSNARIAKQQAVAADQSVAAAAEPAAAIPQPQPVKKAPPKEEGKPRKQAQQRPEDTMLFTRLRTHSKWVFVFLAAAFAIGFLAFGIGTGGGGIGDVIRDFFNGGSGTTSLQDAQKKVQENPTDATAVIGLANQYQNRGQYADAAKTLETYTKLQPKNVDALRQLAAVRDRQAREAAARASGLQENQGALFSQTIYLFPDSPGFLGALGANPVQDAISHSAQERAQSAQRQSEAHYRQEVATIKTIAALDPTDPQTQLQLGQAASAVGDSETTVAAYEKFLKLSPDDPLAPAVKEQLKQYQATQDQSTQGTEQTG